MIKQGRASLLHRQNRNGPLNLGAVMTERSVPKLSKWPFYFCDLLLLLLAAWIVYHYPHPLGLWPLFFLVLSVLAGGWFGVLPFLAEYRAALKFAESDELTSALSQIENLQSISDQIRLATAQWQSIQEQSGQTAGAAREVAERMTAEAKAFGEFMQKSNDAEKARLRLEVEKLRRGEGEWLQVLVHLLDHVFALYQAGLRSNQPGLTDQLRNFQSACRDTVRRVGLVPFEAQSEASFDEKTHQLVDAETKPAANARIRETVATGYNYQGKLVRRALVSLEEPPARATDQETELGLETIVGPGGEPSIKEDS